MSELWTSPYFGIVATVIAYWVGVQISRRTGLVICNYMLVATVLLIGILLVFDIPYEAYYVGGSVINMFLGPATACMGVTIYNQREALKKNWLPILVGCFAGALTAIVSILLMARLFGLDETMTMSLLPKSVTTPIATAISESQGGIPSITVAAVIVTGMGGNIAAPYLVKLFRIKNPVAAGLGIGTASHAVGTAKALQMGETEGAMSGLAVGVCGIFTALLALFFQFIL